MNQFITVERTHPDFLKYLTGEFSQELRALPVRSYNVNRTNEKVTFQICRSEDIERPSLLVVLAQVFRLDLLSLTLTPALAVATHLWHHGQHVPIVLALMALVILHGAVFCRNDFVDHIHGVDRLNEKGGSRVIQRGWLRAKTVQQLYRILMVVAVGFAAPVLWLRPELLLLCTVVAVLGVFGYSHLRWAKGHWILGDMAIWLCLGPLISMGMSWVIARDISPHVLWVGGYFGTMALSYVGIRHMISMVIDDEAGLTTMPTKLGFDRAKIFIVALFVLNGLVAVWAGGAMVALVGFNFWLAIKSMQVVSPLSSSLYELPKKVLWVHLASGIFYLAQFYFRP